MDLYTALFIALVAVAAIVAIKLIVRHWAGICRFVGVVSIIAIASWFTYNNADAIVEWAESIPEQAEDGGKSIKKSVEKVTKQADKAAKKATKSTKKAING